LARGQALWEGDRHVEAAVNPRKEAELHLDGAFAVKDHGYASGLGAGRPRIGTRRGGGRRGAAVVAGVAKAIATMPSRTFFFFFFF